MINNNPYNIPERKPLSQSKILSETNSSRNSSTYSNNRNSNQVMYGSAIFMKNSSIMNPQYQHNFYQHGRQPLSPHSRFIKPSITQFVTSSNGSQRPVDNCFIGSSILKQNINQKTFLQLKQKIHSIQKRLQLQEQNQYNLNQIYRNKTQNFQKQPFGLKDFDSLRKDDVFIGWINETINKRLQKQNQQIWKKLQLVDQHLHYQKDHQFGSKDKILEQLINKNEQMISLHEQSIIKIKGIQKTIRQMGEDIHLINDKQENLQLNIQKRIDLIQNDIRKQKANEQLKYDKKGQQSLSKDLNDLVSKLKSLQYRYDSRIEKIENKLQNKMKQLQNKMGQLKSKIDSKQNQNINIRPNFELKYRLEPFIIKHIQKLEIYNFKSNIRTGEIQINQITYFVDNQGFLLDNDRNYLTKGPNNQKVRLNQTHLQILKKHKILI